MAALPPLNAIRAFEAAARHLSIARAAEELSVTPAAVSHQIKALEERLGQPLFRRLPRGLALTEAGRSYLPGLTEGFDRIRRATDRLLSETVGGRLVISALPSFAMGWLTPRLGDFRRRHPDIDLVVLAERRNVDLARDPVDLAIRYTHAAPHGLAGEVLLHEQLFVVCAPRLMNAEPPVTTPADLIHHTLLHDEDAGVHGFKNNLTWYSWLAPHGLSLDQIERGLRFNDTNLIHEAALRGFGFAIGRNVLIDDYLAAGRLVRPFPEVRKADQHYLALTLPERNGETLIQIFLRWLRDQAAVTGAPAARGSGYLSTVP